ncbi:MAG: Enoyl-CoA hydratase/isomerase, partial [uncultured bacterium]
MNSRYQHLVVRAHDGVLNVQIDRPEKHNALSRAVLSQLRDVFTTHAADDTLRVAILRGAGDKSFA